MNFIVVFLGGGLGALLRYFITQLSNKLCGCSQWGTFGSNILGCFLIGLVFGFTLNKINFIPAQLKLFITVGFLGGLTTFSTFSNEAICFLKDGKILQGGLYVTVSIIFGLLSTYAGYTIGNITEY